MNPIFHPFLSKQHALRVQLEMLQGRYEAEVQECFDLTEQNITLRKQIRTLEVQLQTQAAKCEQDLHDLNIFMQGLERGADSLRAERDNLKVRNADLEDEVARLKHKKKPDRAEPKTGAVS